MYNKTTKHLVLLPLPLSCILFPFIHQQPNKDKLQRQATAYIPRPLPHRFHSSLLTTNLQAFTSALSNRTQPQASQVPIKILLQKALFQNSSFPTEKPKNMPSTHRSMAKGTSIVRHSSSRAPSAREATEHNTSVKDLVKLEDKLSRATLGESSRHSSSRHEGTGSTARPRSSTSSTRHETSSSRHGSSGLSRSTSHRSSSSSSRHESSSSRHRSSSTAKPTGTKYAPSRMDTIREDSAMTARPSRYDGSDSMALLRQTGEPTGRSRTSSNTGAMVPYTSSSSRGGMTRYRSSSDALIESSSSRTASSGGRVVNNVNVEINIARNVNLAGRTRCHDSCYCCPGSYPGSYWY